MRASPNQLLGKARIFLPGLSFPSLWTLSGDFVILAQEHVLASFIERIVYGVSSR